MSRWIKEGLCNTFYMLFVFVSPSLAPHRPQSFPPAAEEKHAHQRVSGAEQNQGSDQAGRRPAPLQPRQQRVTGPGPVRAPHHAGGGAAPAEVSETRASVRFCSDLGFQTEELIFLLFFFYPGCYRFSTNRSLRSKPPRQDRCRTHSTTWPSTSHLLLRPLPCLRPRPCSTPPLPCPPSRPLWVDSSTAPGIKPLRPPPLPPPLLPSPPPAAVAPLPSRPATHPLCLPWPPLLSSSRPVCTSASKRTLIPACSSSSSPTLPPCAPSRPFPNQPCGGWTRSPAPALTCRSWVWLHSSSSSAAASW